MILFETNSELRKIYTLLKISNACQSTYTVVTLPLASQVIPVQMQTGEVTFQPTTPFAAENWSQLTIEFLKSSRVATEDETASVE